MGSAADLSLWSRGADTLQKTHRPEADLRPSLRGRLLLILLVESSSEALGKWVTTPTSLRPSRRGCIAGVVASSVSGAASILWEIAKSFSNAAGVSGGAAANADSREVPFGVGRCMSAERSSQEEAGTPKTPS